MKKEFFALLVVSLNRERMRLDQKKTIVRNGRGNDLGTISTRQKGEVEGVAMRGGNAALRG